NNSNYDDARYAVVVGGYENTASAYKAFVGGGLRNTASGQRSVVVGGQENEATHEESVVAGGQNNSAGANNASIGGGYDNEVSGAYSTIPGGRGLTLSGSGSMGFLGGNTGSNNMSLAEDDIVVFGNTDLLLANNNGNASSIRFYEPESGAGTFPSSTH